MKRGVHTYVGKNYVVPTSLDDCVQHLDQRRPTFTCIYFSAAWNPYCEKIQKDYENFCNANGGFYHMMVDCDATPQIKMYFDARVEPQFLFLLNGMEMKRQIGYNFNLLESHMEEIQDLHLNKADYYGDSGNQWERFYDSFDRWVVNAHADRDALQVKVEDESDQHRGPGAI